MRSLRSVSIAVGLLALVPGLASAQQDPDYLLKTFHPAIKGVDYDVPADAAAIKACKLEYVYDAGKNRVGYALRDGQGKLLRKFLNTDKINKLDQWSYYQDGFEVYREQDLDGDMKLDECRWMNAGGTRVASLVNIPVGADSYKVQIKAWKRLSAEEASKVFVQALVSGDLPLMETVMATPEELTELGLPRGLIDQVTKAKAARVAQVQALQRELKGWNKQTSWSRLDGLMPHLIPADGSAGVKQDLLLYENAVIFPGAPGNAANVAQLAFLQAPEMIKLGDVWKLVELPRAVDPAKPLVAADGGIRSWIFRNEQMAVAGGQDPAVEGALKELAKYDEEHANATSKQDMAAFHTGRIPLLRAVVKVCKTSDEQLVYNKQIVDSLAASYQTGLYPAGLTSLDKMIDEEKGTKLGTYAAFRKIFAEFAVKNDEGGNPLASQKAWMADLKGFLEKNPKADEAPDALLQLASAHEYNAEEEDARRFYQQLAQSYPDSDQGKKAAGALKRLDLVGKTISLQGRGLNKEMIDTSQYRGKTLLVTFWASWADPVRRDLPELVKTYQKHRGQGFEILGVCLDERPEDLDQFLKTNPLPWAQIYEPGGLEKNPLATSYGIIALPTMILVDDQGKVVNRSIRTAAELEKQLEKVLAGKDGGVALGR